MYGESENVRDRGIPVPASTENATLRPLDLAILSGTLRDEQLRQIGRHLANPQPWREDRHPFMSPVVHRDRGSCVVPPSHCSVLPQILPECQWPDRRPLASAHRLRCRTGLSERVLWLSPFLSNDRSVNAIGSFLDPLFGDYPNGLIRLRILSSDLSHQTPVVPRQLAAKLRSLYGAKSWFSRVEWRLFRHGAAHDRHWIVEGRGDVFSLPPADRVLGITKVSNETDSRTPAAVISVDEHLWNHGARVI